MGSCTFVVKASISPKWTVMLLINADFIQAKTHSRLPVLLDLVEHAFNSISQEAESGGFL